MRGMGTVRGGCRETVRDVVYDEMEKGRQKEIWLTWDDEAFIDQGRYAGEPHYALHASRALNSTACRGCRPSRAAHCIPQATAAEHPTFCGALATAAETQPFPVAPIT